MKPPPLRILTARKEGIFLLWFWDFMLYSFLGFILEVVYARASGGRPNRKCLRVLPLCPVYGLGACLILLLPPWVRSFPPVLFLLGGVTATTAEYLTALFYERLLGVSFWNYRDLPGNLQGRVCLPFSLAWGFLSLPLVYLLHPALSPLLSLIPPPVSWAALAALLSDLLLSAVLLRRHRDISCLRWTAHEKTAG